LPCKGNLLSLSNQPKRSGWSISEALVNKTYIGDGVYVSFDGSQFEVITSDGRQATNTIYLEFAVFDNLVRYVENVKATLEKDAR
jgi:hypothetical protein